MKLLTLNSACAISIQKKLLKRRRCYGKKKTMLHRRRLPCVRLLHLHMHKGPEENTDTGSAQAADKST